MIFYEKKISYNFARIQYYKQECYVVYLKVPNCWNFVHNRKVSWTMSGPWLLDVHGYLSHMSTFFPVSSFTLIGPCSDHVTLLTVLWLANKVFSRRTRLLYGWHFAFFQRYSNNILQIKTRCGSVFFWHNNSFY